MRVYSQNFRSCTLLIAVNMDFVYHMENDDYALRNSYQPRILVYLVYCIQRRISKVATFEISNLWGRLLLCVWVGGSHFRGVYTFGGDIFRVWVVSGAVLLGAATFGGGQFRGRLSFASLLINPFHIFFKAFLNFFFSFMKLRKSCYLLPNVTMFIFQTTFFSKLGQFRGQLLLGAVTFEVLWYQFILRVKIEKIRNCVETQGRSGFKQFRIFPILPSIDTTIYHILHGAFIRLITWEIKTICHSNIVFCPAQNIQDG